MVENFLEEKFGCIFWYCVYFNKRLCIIGGCYFLKFYDIEINLK